MKVSQILPNEFYRIEYYEESNLVVFKGNLKLKSVKDYKVVTEFVENIYKNSSSNLVVDFTDLETLNSSGIAAISLFILKVKDSNRKINIVASKNSYWQTISLQDLGDLNKDVTVEFIVKH